MNTDNILPVSNIGHYAHLHRQGKLLLAAQGYRKILSEQPEHYDANHLLAVVLQQQGKLDASRKHYISALEHGKSDAALHSNFGGLLLRSEDFEAAIQQLSKAIVIDPEFFEAWRSRALTYEKLGEHTLAIHDFNKCIRLQRNSYDIWVHKGLCEAHAAQSKRAIISFSTAIAIDAEQYQAYAKCGQLLTKIGNFDEGAILLEKCLERNPNYLPALFSLAENGLLSHNYPAALDTVNKLLSLARDDSLPAAKKVSDWPDKASPSEEGARLQVQAITVSALIIKGKALSQVGRRPDAVKVYTEALSISANDVDSLSLRSQQYISLKNFEAAEADLQHLVTLGAHHDCPLLLGDYLISLRGGFRWKQCRDLEKEIEEKLLDGVYCMMPFPLLSISGSAKLQQKSALFHKATFDQMHAISQKSPAYPAKGRALNDNEKIKVAYVSPDFRHHPVTFLTKGIFEEHDRDRFEVICVSLRHVPEDSEAQEIMLGCDQWLDASRYDAGTLVRELREKQIDIAVDLAGFTSGSRPALFADRIAPVQINFLGFPGTMGKTFMDYIIADTYTVPEETQDFYSEKIIYLDPCFQPNDARRENSIVKLSRKALDLPEESVILCCNNRAEKISPALFEAWASILNQAENTCLWILGIRDKQAGMLKSQLELHGVDPGRLYFSPPVPYSENLARMKNADLMLDTFPFNGGTSTSEALWTGVPVLTVSGEAFASRMSGSLVKACGLSGLVAESFDEYVEKAITLASDHAQISALKKHLSASRNSLPLFNTKLYTKRLEAAYEEVVHRAQVGFRPQHVRV